MKTAGVFLNPSLALALFSILTATLAPAQDPTLLVNVASDSLAAGDSMSVWMTALNETTSDISWSFPPRSTAPSSPRTRPTKALSNRVPPIPTTSCSLPAPLPAANTLTPCR